MNKVMLIGNIVNDPELRYTVNNKAVTNFRLAVRRNYKNPDGTYSSDFINCTVFGKPAAVIQKYCKKGNRIGVVGRIVTGSYEKDERTIYTTEVTIEEFEFLTKKPNKNTPDNVNEQKTFIYTDEEGEELPFD